MHCTPTILYSNMHRETCQRRGPALDHLLAGHADPTTEKKRRN